LSRIVFCRELRRQPRRPLRAERIEQRHRESVGPVPRLNLAAAADLPVEHVAQGLIDAVDGPILCRPEHRLALGFPACTMSTYRFPRSFELAAFHEMPLERPAAISDVFP
jgi:hypothetical protein